MRDVADVGEVEDVGVVAELDVRLVGLVGFYEAVQGLDVALAEYARWAEGCGEELRRRGAVGREDKLFGRRLVVVLVLAFCFVLGVGWGSFVIPWSRRSTQPAGRRGSRATARQRF